MHAAEISSQQPIRALASERQVTRLGESVFRHGRISREALNELCVFLSRMTETIRKLDVSGIRTVATSAVRDSSNQQEFIERVSAVIGTGVEIISGLEEARLIHLGVLSLWPHPSERLLLIDVGGGSAEIILSENGLRREAFSKPLGAVRLTEVFLKNDPPAPIELQRLEQYIHEKVAPSVERIGTRRFDRVIGTSATAAALISAVHRIPRDRREQADRKRISTQQLRRLYRDLVTRTLSQRRRVPGVGPRRAEIIIAGAAAFLHTMEAFQLHEVHYSTAGVKDGIIADLFQRGVGSERSRLDRDQRRVVEQMARKYGVQVPHARQVAQLAVRLFESTEPLHKLPQPAGRLLEAAAYLHDTGHFISDSAHHKHSAYVVANSGMPGFTDAERQLIAMLCRFHRKSMPAPRHLAFQALSPADKNTVLLLLPLLRLADSLDRSHAQQIESVDCQLRGNSVLLEVQSHAGADLDLWAAERVSDIFRQIYGKALQLAGTKA